MLLHSSVRLPRPQEVHRSQRSRGRRRISIFSVLRTSTPLTEKLFRQFDGESDAEGAGGKTTYAALQRADRLWKQIRNEGLPPLETFVKKKTDLLKSVDYDVVVCGGTLGIFLACSLQLKGYRVAVVERGVLKGRRQEWNVSRQELQTLKQAGMMTKDEIEMCIVSEWEKVRAGFHGGHEVWTTGVLNTGISPEMLIDKFLEAGGTVHDCYSIDAIDLHNNGVGIRRQDSEMPMLSGKLVIDCMGHFSPIVRQSRKGQRPDGVCLVVGTCAGGFSNNDFSDLIKTNSPILTNTPSGNRVQYFWEAFPAGSGPSDRTTYLFAYVDATPDRPSLEDLFEDYWQLMPIYQDVRLEDLTLYRGLFGFFPTYRDSPMVPQFDRVVHVGDAGGLQSPLSFGGFGAMLRHLDRHTVAIASALDANLLDKTSLARINPYNPGLSVTWLFQRVMSARQGTPPNLINTTLSANFRVMEQLGPKVLRPFLQDVTRFGPLTLTLAVQLANDPGFLISITRSLGVAILMEWLPHYLRLGFYTAASSTVEPLRHLTAKLPSKDRYKLDRLLDALEYGSGADYDHADDDHTD